jgi:hypothetical protein
MKKQYEKPTLVARQLLSKVTADVPSNFVPPPP